MKFRKVLMCIVVMFFSSSLVSCTYDYELQKEIDEEIKRETPSYDIEGLGITDVFEAIPDKNGYLSFDNVNGDIYVMGKRKEIEKLKNSQFLFHNQNLKNIESRTYDDFNIRFKNQTYFSIKKLDVKSSQKIRLTTDYTDTILFVIREKELE